MQAELEPQGRHVSKQCLGLTYVDDDGDDISVSSDHKVRQCVCIMQACACVCVRVFVCARIKRASMATTYLSPLIMR